MEFAFNFCLYYGFVVLLLNFFIVEWRASYSAAARLYILDGWFSFILFELF